MLIKVTFMMTIQQKLIWTASFWAMVRPIAAWFTYTALSQNYFLNPGRPSNMRVL